MPILPMTMRKRHTANMAEPTDTTAINTITVPCHTPIILVTMPIIIKSVV